MRFTVDEREHGGGDERWSMGYVPSAGSLRVRDDGGGFTWVALTPRAVFERAARALPPLPEARLTGLRADPPASSVDEPVPPAHRAGAASRSTGGSGVRDWIAATALGAALLLAALGWAVRRRRHVQPAGM